MAVGISPGETGANNIAVADFHTKHRRKGLALTFFSEEISVSIPAVPAKVTEGNVCVGCVYEKGGQNFKEFGPVILASGRIGAFACFAKGEWRL